MVLGFFWLIVTEKPSFNRMPVLDTERQEVDLLLGEFPSRVTGTLPALSKRALPYQINSLNQKPSFTMSRNPLLYYNYTI